MHIQASAFPLIKPEPSARVLHHHRGQLCVHAGSAWARIPLEWSNSILIYSNLNLSKRADARVTSAQLFGGNIVSLSQMRHSGTPDSDDMQYEGRPRAFSFLLASLSFSPLIAHVWVLSQKAILRLCLLLHICTNTLAFERAPRVGPEPKSGPEEQLERYRLMAQETAEASGMNK